MAKYESEQDARKRLFAMGYGKRSYTMPSDEVFRTLHPLPKKKKPSPQKTLDLFEKAGGGAAFNYLNPRTVASCKRYMEAGIEGKECRLVLGQVQQYERLTGRKMFDIDMAQM
jgi:hypothetical protein